MIEQVVFLGITHLDQNSKVIHFPDAAQISFKINITAISNEGKPWTHTLQSRWRFVGGKCVEVRSPINF